MDENDTRVPSPPPFPSLFPSSSSVGAALFSGTAVCGRVRVRCSSVGRAWIPCSSWLGLCLALGWWFVWGVVLRLFGEKKTKISLYLFPSPSALYTHPNPV